MLKEINTEILIVGGGPAGASTGICLMQGNFNCTIVDKDYFPREKLCGGLITEVGINELRSMGVTIDNEIFYRPSKIRFFDRNIKIFEYESGANYSVVERFKFDALLIDKFKSLGGKTILGERVNSINKEEKYVVTQSGMKITYKYLIGADGANSTVRKVLNKKRIKLAFCCEVTATKEEFEDFPTDGINVIFNKIKIGFAWVFERNNESTVGVGGIVDDNKEIVKHLSQIYRKAKNIKGAFVPYGELPSIRASENIFLIGDAGGYVDPILGEGISYALLSGKKILNVLNDVNKKKRYGKEFSDLKKMVKCGNVFQYIFFSKRINKIFLNGIKNHRNFAIRICENLVMKGSVKYYEIGKIFRLIFNKGV